MNRRAMRISAVLGAAAVSTLAVAPAFAVGATSQATAQSVNLAIGGSTVVSQDITATNDGTTETRNDASTVPTLADLLTGNNALGAGVAPQDARANDDGTSFACAGLAGTGGGIAYVGDSSCDIDSGQVLTLNLGSLDLDLVNLLGSQGALTGPLAEALEPIILPVGTALDDVIAELTASLQDTPLGQISLEGALSTIAATCTADTVSAQGGAEILDSSGDRTIPIRVTLPTAEGGTQTLNLVDLDVDLEPRPGGYNLLVNLDDITAALFAAIQGQVETAVGGAFSALNDALEPLFAGVQDQIVTALVDQLRDQLLQPLSDNLLEVVVLDRTFADAGQSVDVTALRVNVLGAAEEFSGHALVEGMVGHVTCGPNAAGSDNSPPLEGPGSGGPGDGDEPGDLPDIPNLVNSGVAGNEDHTARYVLGATAALMLLAGTAGLAGYRRLLIK
ncbi:MAG TPA: hypothetical protein VGE14_01040 [Marmoricola sp.]